MVKKRLRLPININKKLEIGKVLNALDGTRPKTDFAEARNGQNINKVKTEISALDKEACDNLHSSSSYFKEQTLTIHTN